MDLDLADVKERTKLGKIKLEENYLADVKDNILKAADNGFSVCILPSYYILPEIEQKLLSSGFILVHRTRKAPFFDDIYEISWS